MVSQARLAEIWATGRHDDDVLVPVAPEPLNSVFAALGLGANSRVSEVGCGNGALLLRIARDYAAACLGLDTCEPLIRAGRRAVARAGAGHLVTLRCEDGFAFPFQPASFDVALCLGASWIFGGYRRTLAALSRRVRQGGIVVVGEGFSFDPPEQAYFRGRATSLGAFRTHEGNVAIGSEEGLQPVGAWVSSQAEWDEYHERRFASIRRWLEENPLDADFGAVTALADDGEARFRLRDRDEQRWAVYAFRKPEPMG